MNPNNFGDPWLSLLQLKVKFLSAGCIIMHFGADICSLCALWWSPDFSYNAIKSHFVYLFISWVFFTMIITTPQSHWRLLLPLGLCSFTSSRHFQPFVTFLKSACLLDGILLNSSSSNSAHRNFYFLWIALSNFVNEAPILTQWMKSSTLARIDVLWSCLYNCGVAPHVGVVGISGVVAEMFGSAFSIIRTFDCIQPFHFWSSLWLFRMKARWCWYLLLVVLISNIQISYLEWYMVAFALCFMVWF